MSSERPAPPTMVVFSFSTSTRVARPSISGVTFSSLMPRSSETTWPPVSTAMSSSMALRRSPKPGAFTAATFRPPRSLFTTSGLQRGQLLLEDQDVRIFELGVHLLRVGDEVGRHVAAVELHALDDVELGLDGLRLLERHRALVADLLHGPGAH